MSFSINGPDPTPAIQRAFHANDGGAGNLGYFNQGKKKKKDEDKDENDVLELSTKKDEEAEEEKEEKNPDSIGIKIKTFWFRIHGIFSEVVEDSENEDKNNDK